jgi:hypothetical protein
MLQSKQVDHKIEKDFLCSNHTITTSVLLLKDQAGEEYGVDYKAKHSYMASNKEDSAGNTCEVKQR